jgi:hypothetical protein
MVGIDEADLPLYISYQVSEAVQLKILPPYLLKRGVANQVCHGTQTLYFIILVACIDRFSNL